MTVNETFNTGVSGKELSAVCTGYENFGKVSRVTNPFFLAGLAVNMDSASLASVCLAPGLPATNTTYDMLGRVVLTVGPDGSQGQHLLPDGLDDGHRCARQPARRAAQRQGRTGQGQ
jgi:hypothetical protein